MDECQHATIHSRHFNAQFYYAKLNRSLSFYSLIDTRTLASSITLAQSLTSADGTACLLSLGFI